MSGLLRLKLNEQKNFNQSLPQYSAIGFAC